MVHFKDRPAGFISRVHVKCFCTWEGPFEKTLEVIGWAFFLIFFLHLNWTCQISLHPTEAGRCSSRLLFGAGRSAAPHHLLAICTLESLFNATTAKRERREDLFRSLFLSESIIQVWKNCSFCNTVRGFDCTTLGGHWKESPRSHIASPVYRL